MTVVARRVRATPARTGVETWRFIVDLVALSDSDAWKLLSAAEGVVGCLIADETPKDAPIVVAGCGPRLRVYCLYGSDAIAGDDSDEEGLTWNPTEDSWQMWVPVSAEDHEWVSSALKKLGPRIVAYDPQREEPGVETRASARAQLEVNEEAFKRS